MSSKYSNLEDAMSFLEKDILKNAIEAVIDHVCQQEGIKLKRERFVYPGDKLYTAVAKGNDS